jgi:RNA polymerase sigma-70 factor (ECF subfamily)
MVQESLLNTFLAAQKGRLVSVKGFLFAVAVNSAFSRFRRRKFISSTPVNEIPALRVMEDDVEVFETVCARDELLIMAEAIAQLPDQCRKTVTLRVVHGLEYPAIARELELSESTVRVQIARGMAKCARFLQERNS